MNALDLMIVLAAVVAAVGGWRLGFLARLLGWLGIFVGLAIGSYFVPGVVVEFGGATPQTRAAVALIFLVFVASAGQAAGLLAGLALRRAVPAPARHQVWDRGAGALVGVVGVAVVVWMATPALASAKGWPAVEARESVIVGAIDRASPRQPRGLEAWARWIAQAPSVFGPLTRAPNFGPPPQSALAPEIDAAVRPSTVKISAEACGRIQEGSGWVAGPQTVVTNAHVVAGEFRTTVETLDGEQLPATLVAFDPVRDLAVLRVRSLSAPPLPIGTGSEGGEGAVYGHPGGGPLTVAPARIGQEIIAEGTDIYHRVGSRRHVYILAARLASGDSGGALVDKQGTVVGVAFAIAPDDPATAYALTTAEVRPVLESVTGSAVPSGACVAG